MKAYLLCSFFLMSGLAYSADKSLPPLGKRTYFIELQNPASPVEILPRETLPKQGVSIMRDPIPLGAKPVLLKPTTSSHSEVSLAKPKQVSRIVFDKMAVKGRYSVPRVSFDRPVLEVKRRDEPIHVDYRKKLKESENTLRDFEW